MYSDHTSINDRLKNLSRRDLFRTAGVAVWGAALLGLPKFMGSRMGEAEAATDKRTATSLSHLALELEGQPAGILKSAEGGNAFAQVIPESIGRDLIQRKRPGPVRFEDIVIRVQLGSAQGKPIYDWINQFLAQGSITRNGAIVYADVNQNEVRRLEFFNAQLTEIEFSPLDASSKDRIFAMLRITPQSTRLVGGKGKAKVIGPVKSTAAFSNLYRFNAQGLENSCKNIYQVDSIVAKRPIATAVDPTTGKEKFKQPGSGSSGILDVSTIGLTLPMADAGPFYAWFEDFVVKGNPGGERSGLLEWLGPDMKPIGGIQLFGLGIFRIVADKTDAVAEKVSRVGVDMYCETMKLNLL